MRIRGGVGSDRKKTERICAEAIRPILDMLEDRRMLSITPVVSFNFNQDPAAGGALNAGSGGAAYNGALAGQFPPVFQNASPSPAGGGYLTFQGSSSEQGFGGSLDTATGLETVLGGSGTLAFYIRSTTNSQSGGDAVWQSPAITGVEQASGASDIFYGDIGLSGNIRGAAGNGAAIASANPITDGLWHQVTITRDATSGKIAVYVDGALSGSGTSEAGNKTAPFNSIGALVDRSQDLATINGYNYFNGDLDQVDIYNQVLSAQDVATQYGAATAAPTTPVLTDKTSGPLDARLAIGSVDNELGFNVLRADSAAGPFTQIASLAPDATGFSDTNVTVGNTYYYKVVAFNNIGTAESAVVTTTIPATGTGLNAYYYNTGFWGNYARPADLNSYVVSKPTQKSAVAQIDYNWGTGTPTPPFSGTLQGDNFSTAFVGTLLLPKDLDGDPSVDSTYTVTLISNTDDDGLVFANGQVVSNDPNGHGPRDATNVTPITVTEGVPVDLIMLQAEQGGGAAAQLKWEVTRTSDGSQVFTRQIVPEEYLHMNQVALGTADKPVISSVSQPEALRPAVDFSSTATSELRFELWRSTGSTFNASTATLVGVSGINSTRVMDGYAAPGATYTYVVRAINSVNSVDSAPTTYTVPALAQANGVSARWFNNPYWGNFQNNTVLAAGTPDTTNVVDHVNFNWGSASPAPGIAATNYSTIFTGKVTIPDNGNGTPNEQLDVRIMGSTDDDGYVFVNGVLVSADPGGHGLRDADQSGNPLGFSNTIKLTEGQSYDFVFLQSQGGGGAGAFLRWINPATGAREDIPSQYLTPLSGPAPAPTGVAAPSIFLGAHQVKLTWTDNATNEVRYEIDRAVVTGGVVGAFSPLALLAINSNSYIDSGLTNSTTYAYRIRAVNYEGSAAAPDFQVTTLDQDIPPDAPTSTIALPRSTGVLVTFTDNAVNENQFVIERATVTGGVTGAFAEITRLAGSAPGATGGRFEYNDATAVNGTTYVYRVYATNAGGNSANAVSAQVTAAAQGGTGLTATWYDNIDFTGTTVTKQVPAFQDFGNNSPDPAIGPDQFSGILVGSIKAELSEAYTFWTSSDDGIDLTLIDSATGQVLIDHGGGGLGQRRGLAANGGFSESAGTANLVAGHTYVIQVRHVEDGGGAGYRVGWSSPSLPLEVLPTDLIFAAGTETLVPPGNVKAVTVGDEAVNVTFVDTNPSETGYVVERATSANGPWAQVGTVAANVGVGNLLFTDNGPLQANQTYFYRLHAVRDAEVGPDSAVASVTTKAAGGTDLTINGTGTVLPGADNDLSTGADNVLRLVDNVNNEVGSVFTKNAQDLLQAGKGTAGATGFSTSFQFTLPEFSSPAADGFTFTLQRMIDTATGGGGGDLGYSGIKPSVAVRFKIYNGTDPNFTHVGIYTNGVIDNTTTDDDPGFFIANGHNFRADISYDDSAKALTLTITDLTDNTIVPFTKTYSVDIPGTIGGHEAFVGFTGATGGLNTEIDLSNWNFNGTQLPFLAPPVGVTAPKVTGVYVNGTAWKQSFRDYLASTGVGSATLGYKVLDGTGQLKDLPWTNLNQISITFDGDVAVDQADLALKGINTATLASSAFTYDAVNHVATWTLPTLTKDKLLIELSGSTGGVSAAGDPTLLLDGDWTTSVTTGSSGDGTAGGDFDFRLNVLPGDVNQTAPVNATDVTLVKNRQLSSVTNPTNYGIFYDVDGSGSIIASDVALVKNRQLTTLPPGEPAPSAPVATQAVSAAAVAAPVTTAPVKATSTSAPKTLAKPAPKPAPAPKVVSKPSSPSVFASRRIKNDLLA
jgi:hypothetical protein